MAKKLNRAIQTGTDVIKKNGIGFKVREFSGANRYLRAEGITLPTGVIGFEKGATFRKTDVVDGTKSIYENTAVVGTAAVWNLIGDITAGEITLANGDSFDDSGGLEVIEWGVITSAVNHVKITNASTGNNAILGVEGTDASVGLNITAKAGLAATNAGGTVIITGGAGNTTGTGGVVGLTSGAGSNGAGAVNGANSGAINILSGVAGTTGTGTAGSGGAISVTGAAGGLATGVTGIGGDGAAVTFRGGDGGATTDGSGGAETAGAGGLANIRAGAGGNINAASTGDGGEGGSALLTSGAGGTGGTGVGGDGGITTITGGAGGATSGAGGDGGFGGNVVIRAGVGGADGQGGSGTGGDGGDVTLTPGVGGAGATPGASGNVIISGGRGIKSNVTNGFVPMIISAAQDAITDTAAASVTNYYTTLTTTQAATPTLADGTIVGQTKKIQMIVRAVGDAVFTPENLNDGTTITFADVGDTAELLWEGAGWQVLALYNIVDGATAPVLA